MDQTTCQIRRMIGFFGESYLSILQHIIKLQFLREMVNLSEAKYILIRILKICVCTLWKFIFSNPSYVVSKDIIFDFLSKLPFFHISNFCIFYQKAHQSFQRILHR